MSENTGIGSLTGMRKWLGRMLGSGVGATHGGSRDVWGTLGYPTTITINDMWTMYLRGGVASRIVRAAPQATWREHPLVRDEKGSQGEDRTKSDYSPFVEAVDTFLRDTKALAYLERADRLSRIGRFGVLLMGFADGQRLDMPLKAGKAKLMYLQPYGEPMVKITTLDNNPSSPRFGLPEFYTVAPTSTVGAGGMIGQSAHNLPSQLVHHSRILHVAEMLDADNVFSQPVLQPVFNNLLDLEKVIGSSAETFWLNARGGMSLSVDADAELDHEAKAALKAQADEYEHQLRRILTMQGVTAQMLTTNVADPGPNIEALLDIISGTVGMPKRILVGSERGELSSNQDENNWGQRIDERQAIWATPNLLVPFLQKMIDTGNLPKASGDWWAEWPQSTTLSPERQAEVGSKRAATLAAYANSPTAQLVVPMSEFRHEFLGLDATSSFDEGESSILGLSEEDLEVLEQFRKSRDGSGGTTPEAIAAAAAGDDAESSTVDPSTATVTGQPGGDASPAPSLDEKPADTALNGAQIASLRGIVEAVGAKTMPLETAVRLILISFPTITEEQTRAILAPIVDFEGAEPEPVPAALAEANDAVGDPDQDKVDPEDPDVQANVVRRLIANVMAGDKRGGTIKANATMRTLYVRRPVLNAHEILAHYKAQGVSPMVPEAEMHVTIAYTKAPVDWEMLPPQWDLDSAELMVIPGGGMRMDAVFGPDATVLCFRDHRLEWRHTDFVAAGAQWKHPSFRPHITLTYREVEDIEKLQPYQGPIILGRELWSQASSDWADELVEV